MAKREKPRFIFINLQETNFLVQTYDAIRSGWKVKTFKHKFILDYIVQSGFEVFNYLVCEKEQEAEMFRECSVVYEENGYKGKIKTITDPSFVTENDILIVYYHYFDQYQIGKNIKCKKIVMGNHFIKVSEKHDLFLDGYDAFVNEIDLSNNEFVNRFFEVSKVHNIMCPYVFADRFIDTKPFDSRLNKAMAVGTLSTCADMPEYSGYRNYFGTDWIQPMRREILRNKKKLKQIDCYISYLYEGQLRIRPQDGKVEKLIKRVYNRFHRQQYKYTSFDMVQKFNEYKVFICPEELVGMPGIGFVEGMACGTAYMGLDSDMYKCLGLIPNYHYIAYDGTLDGLQDRLCYYLNHENELRLIAERGTRYVREHFNSKVVAEKFVADLIKMERIERYDS